MEFITPQIRKSRITTAPIEDAARLPTIIPHHTCDGIANIVRRMLGRNFPV